MNNYYVYEWIRLDTNEPFYVGKGKENRAYKLTRGNNKHFNSIVKRIPTAVHILHGNLTEEEALEYEIWYIYKYRDEIGYDLVNNTDGGEGVSGFKHSAKTIELLKGNHNSPTSGKHPMARKIICLTTGKIFDTIIEASKYYNIKSWSNITHCCQGKRYYCGNIGDKLLTWAYYDDYKQLGNKYIKNKIHNTYRGLRLSESNANSKKVICLTTHKIFNSIRDGEKEYNISASSISQCCTYKRKSAGKLNNKRLEWMYYDEYIRTKNLNEAI